MIFFTELGLAIVAPVLPSIMADFCLSGWQIGLVFTVYATARLILDLPMALLLKRLPAGRLLVLGTMLAMIGAAGCSLATDYLLLLAARFVMGSGTALSIGTGLFVASRAAGAESRGRAMSLFQASSVAGITFGPAIGGGIAALAGWRGESNPNVQTPDLFTQRPIKLRSNGGEMAGHLLDPRVEAVLSMAREGLSLRQIARQVGVSYETMRRWLRK